MEMTQAFTCLCSGPTRTVNIRLEVSGLIITFASSSPELGVAVRTAEAGAVVNVLVGHQPLQRINRLQTRHTGLPHRQPEALHAQKKKKKIH